MDDGGPGRLSSTQMLIKNATAISFSPPRVKRLDLRVKGEKIAGCGRSLHARQGEEVIDLSGRYLMPGMVCAHTHLYSSLSRGMPPGASPRSFIDVLRKVWWRLDRALDEETIYYSALVGAMDAVRFGTTTLVDHHASPNCIRGSLDLIASSLNRVGLRGVLCYETTDRGGIRRRDDGLEENERFLLKHRTDPRIRGLIGAHASFTVGTDTLRELGRMVQAHESGIHIHVAEAPVDSQLTRRRWRRSVVERLDSQGLLTSRSVLAHGVHLSPVEIARCRGTGAWLVHNPRSNMNNAVGHAPIERFGRRAALGTDGFPADMFEESKIGFFRSAESGDAHAMSRIADLVQGGQHLLSRLFGERFGGFEVGSPADLIVLDYDPPTPLVERNLTAHLCFGMQSSMVENVLIGGRWIVWNRRFVFLDEERIMRDARKASARLWKKMENLR